MYSSPVRHSPAQYCYCPLPFDLHVLGLPPAFTLSQDQTLQLKLYIQLLPAEADQLALCRLRTTCIRTTELT